MYCNSCGSAVTESATFCSKCGKSMGTASTLMPRQGRIAGHIRLLGILWLAISALRLIPALVLLAFAGASFFPPDIPQFVHAVLPAIGLCLLVISGLGIVAGCGLLMRQGWARMMTVVFGAIGLIDIPFGTALGVYTLWVLLPAESEQEYRSMANAA